MSNFWKRLFGRADDLPPSMEPSAEGISSSSKAAFGKLQVDLDIRADRLIRATKQEVASRQIALVEESPNLEWVRGRAEAWQLCLLAASIGLAATRETPGLVDTVDRILARDSPRLREAVGDFLNYLVARDKNESRIDLPTYIGQWVLRNYRVLPDSQRIVEESSYSTVGGFCIRMGGSWDVEREPSLLVYRFRSAALDLSLLRNFPELAEIDEEAWELLFTIASFVAVTMVQGGEELLDESLASELNALHPDALHLFGACAGFVSEFLTSLHEKSVDPDSVLAIALGTWVTWRGFGRDLGPEEDNLVCAVGQQVVNSVRAVL